MPDFVDTNVLVYARDDRDATKRDAAAAWLEHLWRHRTGRLSWQVLQEFYVTVTRKLTPGMTTASARADVRNLAVWRPIATTATVMEAAWSLADRHSISFWDSLIVAAAGAAGCERLLTEDLTDGAEFGQVTVVNPFVHSPPSA